MGSTLKQSKTEWSSAFWCGLPSHIRVLYIATAQRTGGWLAEAFAADSASEVFLEEVSGSTAGLARLRDEPFDAVLVSHKPGELDAVELVEGYRAGGASEPIIVLGTQSEQEMAAVCYEVGADAYVCVNTTTTRNLIWIVARTVQRHELLCENRRLTLAERRRTQQERDEADRLLQQQRALIGNMATLKNLHLPAELVAHYRELLRTYVIMGSGNLADELSRLAKLLTTAGVTARETMQLHLHVLEELVHGLGTRSCRHVMSRADLLVLEIMIHLAESYRARYQERLHPPMQLMLPGFDKRA